MKIPYFLFADNLKKTQFYFADAEHEIIARKPEEILPCLQWIEDLQKQGFYLAGYIGYEVGWVLASKVDDLLQKKRSESSQLPYLHFFAFSKMQETAWQEHSSGSEILLEDWHTSLTREDYAQGFQYIQEQLKKGNSYQINYTFFERFKCNVNAQELFRKVSQLQKTQYSAYLDYGDYRVLSFSPELFLQKKGNKLICEPMKGTLPSSFDKTILSSDEKAIAENLMIVDLIRNDLGKIADPGSVVVEQLFEVKTLETVHQMISRVVAQISHRSFLEVLQSLFPCGSITGAPKLSSMKIIAQVEKEERGIYTGAIGYLQPQGDFCFNVAIRTIVEKQGMFSCGVGGGILIDSDEKSEFEEAKLKSLYLRKVNSYFQIFETVYFDGSKIKNFSEHLLRLEASARYFGFLFDREPVVSKILRGLEKQRTKCKVKIVLFYNGHVEWVCSELEPTPNSRVQISPYRVDSTNIFQKHKTTQRSLYDQEYRRAIAEGLYDVLFFNEKNELVEASRNNIFLRQKKQWKTPSLSTGCLPGIERAHRLRVLLAQECSLTLQDLQSADEILLTNSVRGAVPVVWERQ